MTHDTGHNPGACANAMGEWCAACMLPIEYAAAPGDPYPYNRSREWMLSRLGSGRPALKAVS